MSKRTLSALFILLLMVLSVSLSSCSTSNKVTIQPLKNIAQGLEALHVQDIGTHSAKIIFEANSPIVCNIAYGIDKNYGRLALMAMAGPTTDHEVQLLGLEPNTTYHFRITATDLASKVYQSDDLTFATIQGDTKAKPAGRNVAAISEGARIVGVSSNWGNGNLDSSFGGNKAIDGNPSTEWSSNGDGNSAWIEIELSQSFDLNTIGFWTRTMGNSAQISNFNVVVDDSQHLGPFNLPDASTIYYFQIEVRAKRLRFEIESSSGGNTGAIEIEAYSVQR
ncbi:MAG: discoidin domain-containing protein [Chloroflexi bacterium]|nr:discoidin domain-containing protein [Chloroflexota bacterium]